MNRTILQRRRQRQRWRRLAVAMGPHPSLPPRWRRLARAYQRMFERLAELRRRWAPVAARSRYTAGGALAGEDLPALFGRRSEYNRRKLWLGDAAALSVGAAEYRVFASAGGESDAPAGTLIDVEWVPGVPIYVQEVRADGQVDGGFLSAMLTREEGDDE